jgi:Ca-activated chloride channel family protein
MHWLDLSSLEFQWPWLLLLLPLPWLPGLRAGQRSTRQLVAPQLPIFGRIKALGLAHHAGGSQRSGLRGLLLALAWVALVLALTRPTWIGDPVSLPLSGRDLMLAVDISPSMKEQDMTLADKPVTRLDVVKDVVAEFVQKRAGDRVGLILFGSQPYIQAPLTFDLVTVNTLLQESFLGMAGQATAIGDAIALGVKRLRQRPEQSRVLILLTDGSNTAGDIPPDKAAQLAAQERIRVYTIGVGAEEMIQRSFFGSRRVNPSADLDEKMLQRIAETTGGQYFRARDRQEMDRIYDQIDALEPIEHTQQIFRPSKSLFHWLLGLSLALYGLHLLVYLFGLLMRRRQNRRALERPLGEVSR